MIINQEQLSLEFNDSVKFDYDLKKKNWFNIGGKTKIYFKANNLKDLINFLKKIEKKEKAQPTKIKTSGSTFKNPLDQTEKKVWQLIKESVSLEKSFGDACISKKHCNFFVNKGDAKFDDMKKLIEFVSESVLKKTGVKLETEIKILE